MNSSNLFVLGLLLLTANLSLGAIFSPARVGRADADRLLMLWKLVLLASIQIGSWAIVLDQGGAAPTLPLAFTRAAACFALIGGSGGGLVAPWGEVAPFIALNGLLYFLLSTASLVRGQRTPREADGDAEFHGNEPVLKSEHAEKVSSPVVAQPAPALAPSPAIPDVRPSRVVAKGGAGITAEREPRGGVTEVAEASSTPATASSGTQPVEQGFKPGGFRATIPKVTHGNAQLSPEEELAEQMKPVGPTPPPIRFQWKN